MHAVAVWLCNLLYVEVLSMVVHGMCAPVSKAYWSNDQVFRKPYCYVCVPCVWVALCVGALCVGGHAIYMSVYLDH